MKNFQRKIGKRKIIQSRPVLALLGIVVVIFAWSVLKFWNKMRETERNKEIAEEKVEGLREQKEKLQADIESLNTNEGKERVFRENFGLAKEGEEVIIVVEDKNSLEPPKKSFSSSFFDFLKNLFK